MIEFDASELDRLAVSIGKALRDEAPRLERALLDLGEF